jgi:hypothetical protein
MVMATQSAGQGASLTWNEHTVPLELTLCTERSAFCARVIALSRLNTCDVSAVVCVIRLMVSTPALSLLLCCSKFVWQINLLYSVGRHQITESRDFATVPLPRIPSPNYSSTSKLCVHYTRIWALLLNSNFRMRKWRWLFDFPRKLETINWKAFMAIPYFLTYSTGWRAGDRFPVGSLFVWPPQRPDRLWGPPSPLSSGYRWLLHR